MKSLKLFVAILAISISTAKAQFVKAELQVSGLTCSMCSKATEKSLRTLPFISDIKTDLNRNLFTIVFKSGSPVDLELMSKKVQGAGFAINQLKTVVDFTKLKVANNSFNYAGNTFHILNAQGKEPEGQVALTVVNKGFASAATVKKYSQAVSGTSASGRSFHVVI